jgi:parallel beta-helix repeat protein
MRPVDLYKPAIRRRRAAAGAAALLFLLTPACGLPESPRPAEAIDAPTRSEAGETDNPTRGRRPSDAGGSVAADLYVASAGDDQASGVTAEEALGTLERAVELAAPGNRVLILPGVYVESVFLEGVGDPTQPITIAGIPGETILDGERRLPVGLWCEGCSGIILEDIIIRNYTDAAVVITDSEDIVLRGLTVSDSGFAPQVAEWEFEGYGIDVESSSRILIENNQLARIGPDPQRPGHMMGSSIVAYACQQCVIRGNVCSENTGGMVVEDSVGVLVEDNRLENNDLDATSERWWDGAIWLDGGHDVTVRRNLIRHNLGPGIQISDEEQAGPTGYVLEDNVVTDNLIGLYVWNFGTWELPGEPILRLSGNEISGNDLVDVYVSPSWCLAPEVCEE